MAPIEHEKPRIGVPWRTSEEETQHNKPKIDNYLNAVRQAGGEPVLISLRQPPEELARQMEALDGFVLPGSPSDVDPARYGSVDRGLSEPADTSREATDSAILNHALAKKKPVLAICYGCQLLNVYLGGKLIQDVRAETGSRIAHRKKDLEASGPQPSEDPRHPATFERDSRLAVLAGGTRAEINSSHHQAIERPGKNLRVTARSPEDGIIEGIEWTGDSNWVVGVQWHPERMFAAGSRDALDPFALKLFEDFVAAARGAARHKVQLAPQG
jgi:putative glutamine amidotransferase